MALKVRTRIPKISRDLVLFIGGIIGIFNEALLHGGSERPYLLVVFSAMAGLPVFLYQDEHREEKKPSKTLSLQDLAELLEELEKKK